MTPSDSKKCDCGCEKTGEFVTAAEVAKYAVTKAWSHEDTRNLAHARAVNRRAKA